MIQAIDAIDLTADEANALMAEVARQQTVNGEIGLTPEALLARLALKLVRQMTQRVVNDNNQQRVDEFKSVLESVTLADRQQFMDLVAELAAARPK